MKRYTIDNPMDLSIESDDGEFVFYDEAQAEIDRLKARVVELEKWLPIICEIDRRAEKEGCIDERCDFTVTVQYDDYLATTNQAIAKARGGS